MSKAKKTTKKEVVVVEKKSVGRPSNPQSKRQQKMMERELKREAGLLKRGRPSVEGSKCQAVLAAREAKKAAGLEIKRGRPKKAEPETMSEWLDEAANIFECELKKVEATNDVVQLERGE